MKFKTKAELYTSGDIKREAKAQLLGNWGPAIVIAIIPGLFSLLFFRTSYDETLIGIVLELIRDFLVLGVTFSFMNLVRNRNYVLEPLQEILLPFQSKYFLNLLKLKLWKNLFIFLWSLLFVIPGIVKYYSYSQAELIYRDTVDRTGKQPDARACIEESQKRMDGHKADLFMLEFSFIGWYLANGLTFGILSFWLTPYIEMSRVIFYENLTKGYYLTRLHQTQTEAINETFENPMNKYEEVGKDPDDFRDFDDF